MPAIDTFAPMHALEMLKLMLSLASMWRKSRRGGSLTITVVGVKRSHWNADAPRVIYIQLPDEDYEEDLRTCTQGPIRVLRRRLLLERGGRHDAG